MGAKWRLCVQEHYKIPQIRLVSVKHDVVECCVGFYASTKEMCYFV